MTTCKPQHLERVKVTMEGDAVEVADGHFNLYSTTTGGYVGSFQGDRVNIEHTGPQRMTDEMLTYRLGDVVYLVDPIVAQRFETADTELDRVRLASLVVSGYEVRKSRWGLVGR